jgi:exosortase B
MEQTLNRPASNSWSQYADLIVIGLITVWIYLPVYQLLDESIWVNVGQGHGPIMLALTLWLAWDRRHKFMGAPVTSAPAVAIPLFVLAAAFYVVGFSQDMLALSVTSQIFLFSAMAAMYRGVRGMKIMWFPIFFFIFIIPIPGSIVDQITAPLKMAVSYCSEALMHAAGYPIGRSGVILNIGPYQLLVADACAGLNSIFALEAVGVFYMSLMRYKSNARNILLAVSILPISFVSNVIRVICLVLITYYFGDEAGQGFVHSFAGIMLFTIATIFTIGFDRLMGNFVSSEQLPEDTPPQKAQGAAK